MNELMNKFSNAAIRFTWNSEKPILRHGNVHWSFNSELQVGNLGNSKQIYSCFKLDLTLYVALKV